MKNFIILVYLLILIYIVQTPVSALDLQNANNIVGIHLADTADQDLKKAADLVNSQGGEWGYVTVVIQEKDRNRDKWQNVFDKLREHKLIPIVRLATTPIGDKWKKPVKEDAASWAEFLNSLRWVVKDRYIVLFNEPNHGQEWEGATDPKGYGEVALEFTRKIKGKNKDFFIMLAGLDAAAPSAPPRYEDEAVYLTQMFEAQPELRAIIDGLSSHSYPNPGYGGNPYQFGRNTVRNYQWELDFLRGLGVTRELPVFITEAGWPHSEAGNGAYYSAETVGNYLQIAFTNVWFADPRVRAVTPFLLNYQGEPFSSFSWVRPGGDSVYPHYTSVQQIPKVKGDPTIDQSGSIAFTYYKELLIRSTYHFQIQLKNEGQAIWEKEDGYALKLEGFEDEQYIFGDLSKIRPHDEAIVDLFLKTNAEATEKKTRISLYKNDKKILESKQWIFKQLPLPKVELSLSFFPKLTKQDGTIELQIFDSNEQLVYKRKGIELKSNKALIDSIANIALGEKYRVVVLRPYYLPRQTIIKFKKGTNTPEFNSLIPLDFNLDGAFNMRDIISLFSKPSLFWLITPI